jgi:hypothetical protein
MRSLSLALVAMSLGGCSAAWLQEPSESVKSLVHDLTLQGFTCSATASSINCLQDIPYKSYPPSKCDADAGVCVRQAAQYYSNAYVIRQTPAGRPHIQHQLVQVPPPLEPEKGDEDVPRDKADPSPRG